MADENNGKVVTNNVVKAMWDDMNARIEKLGVSNIIFLILSYIHLLYYNFVLISLVIKYDYYFSQSKANLNVNKY